ncbi:MAG TPA: polysaccharide ABC transporter ATP-binding protein [Humisphaera sp.]
MSDIAVRVDRVGKYYRLGGARGYRTVRESLMGLFRRRTAAAAAADAGQDLWALKDVSFEVRRGEVVGVIGRNGAGKSTLLKVLSRITAPTHGAVELTGRVGSLLEVGTGFHPELSGRENIFLNGAILGMTRAEIVARLDEIIAFSGVERFLDTPVKRYSSGMYTRLAFAVAAHLDPEILIVDEVLAVGDAEFQRKCIGKMSDVARSGRTVLFVSHNMGAVGAMCTRGILMHQGRVAFDGTADEAIRRYTTDPEHTDGTDWHGAEGDEHLTLRHTWVRPVSEGGDFDTGASIEIGFEAELHRPIEGLVAGFWIVSEFGYELAYVLFDDPLPPPATVVPAGRLERRFRIPANTLSAGTYRIDFDFGIHMVKAIIRNVASVAFTLDNISGGGRRFPLPNLRGRTSLFRPTWFVQPPAAE